MRVELVVSLVLLILVLLDAIGDAFRLRNWQIPHHIVEVFHVAGWIGVWFAFDFQWLYLPIYILGRIVLFDIVFNLTAGLPIGHIGENSIYDIVVSKLGGWFKQNPANFAFIFRFIALLAWVGTYLVLSGYYSR
jgi:hypothetical protein